jgi:hypothetical protein
MEIFVNFTELQCYSLLNIIIHQKINLLHLYLFTLPLSHVTLTYFTVSSPDHVMMMIVVMIMMMMIMMIIIIIIIKLQN